MSQQIETKEDEEDKKQKLNLFFEDLIIKPKEGNIVFIGGKIIKLNDRGEIDCKIDEIPLSPLHKDILDEAFNLDYSSEMRANLKEQEENKLKLEFINKKFIGNDDTSIKSKAEITYSRISLDLEKAFVFSFYKKEHEKIKLPLSQSKELTNYFRLNSFEGNADKVKMAIMLGVDINNNANDCTALYVACQNGHAGVVEELILAGTDIENKNSDGTTALHIASENGHLEIVKKLIEAGADINAKTSKESATALHFACQNGHSKIAEALIEKSQKNGVDMESFFNAKSDKGATALHLACQNGNLETVNALIKKAQENGINMKSFLSAKTTREGHTALNIASSRGHLDIVNILNKIVEKDSTALHVASANGHEKIVETLIEKAKESGIKLASFLEEITAKGNTAYDLASKHGHFNISKTLSQAMSEINKTLEEYRPFKHAIDFLGNLIKPSTHDIHPKKPVEKASRIKLDKSTEK